jgi:hypothetical protein
MLSLAGGGGLGCGIVFLMEFLNLSVIRRSDQIENVLGLNILTTIPPLEEPGQKMKQMINHVVFACCCCYAALFLGVFGVVYLKGLDRTAAFIKPYLGLIN